MIDIVLSRQDSGWADEEQLFDLSQRVVSTATDILKLNAAGPCELSIVFAGDAMVKGLNAKWRGKDKATNVLSFPAFPLQPGDALPPLLGDVVLAFKTVASEAEHEGKPFSHHVSHLVLHGLLHLLGYDHETEAEAEGMEALERAILAKLAIPDPYAVIDAPS